MLIEPLISSIISFSRLARRQSEPDVSQELREQIVNIIDDLVDEIAPGYLPPNSISSLNYRAAIYEEVYKYLWSEFGRRRFENAIHRDHIFNFLREVPSEKFFNVTEHLLKIVFGIVRIQITIPDDIIPNPSAGNRKWSRVESVRDRHISLFKGAVDKLNHRLSQNNAKCHYKLDGETVQMVKLDTGLDVPEEHSSIEKKDSGIQKKNDNQKPEHHQNQSRSESWNRKNYIIAVVLVILAILEFAFGDGILRPLLHLLWNYLKTLL